MLHKIYRSPGGEGDERRYSPAVCTGIDQRIIVGDPWSTRQIAGRARLTLTLQLTR